MTKPLFSRQARWLAPACLATGMLIAYAQPETPASPPAATATSASAPIDTTIAAIREEGLNHSRFADTLDYLCNVIGPRLTGSPGLKRANEWTRDRLRSWELENAHLESWGPFGKGWTLKRFSLQVVAPQTIVVKAFPKAWSSGFDKPMEAPVIYLDVTRESDFAKYKGQLKGKIVIVGTPKIITPNYTPLAVRFEDQELARAATLPAGMELPPARITPATRPAARPASATASAPVTASASAPATEPFTGNRIAPNLFYPRVLTFASQEGALMVLDSSSAGDGGVMLVQAAVVPFGLAGQSSTQASSQPTSQPSVQSATASQPATQTAARGPLTIYSLDAPSGILPQVTLAIEDFNRIVHMLKQGESLTMAVDLQVEFQTADPYCYNTIAEIPGSDLKDEIVMVGAHMDSWASGTGATDNGAGVAGVMEAVRILKALRLQPRRTIRIALWTGEEQGLLGSRAYVAAHFGSRANARTFGPATEPSTQPEAASRPARGILTKGPDYEKLSIYLNLDNGSGKIRGIYAQSDVAGAELFKQWLKPFNDLGASTVTLANNGSTDHISFDDIGLPGFQFIQDPIDYFSRTHHTNADVYDRVQVEDMKQAATILAAFLWDAANTNERFPRKAPPATNPR